MSDKDHSQPPASGNEQTRDGATPQTERAATGANTEGGRGRSGSGGRHGNRRRHGQPQQPSSPQSQSRRGAENSLNMQELRDLMELFSSHGLTDFEFENEEIRVRLSRNNAPQIATTPPPHLLSHAATDASQHVSAASGSASAMGTHAAGHGGAADAARTEDRSEDLHIITSPIVGTFYRSPSPTSESFVRQGSTVEPDTIVCIIEAMKLMNEIQSETTGVVEKIYVENGQPVEYGQPLFGIKK